LTFFKSKDFQVQDILGKRIKILSCSNKFNENKNDSEFSKKIDEAIKKDIQLRELSKENYNELLDKIVHKVFDLKKNEDIQETHKNAYKCLILASFVADSDEDAEHEEIMHKTENSPPKETNDKKE
jgi:hypothetical protein